MILKINIIKIPSLAKYAILDNKKTVVFHPHLLKYSTDTKRHVFLTTLDNIERLYNVVRLYLIYYK